MEQKQINQPSAAFIAASWTAFFIGAVAFIIGLWNAHMELNEKGYYFTVLMFGLFSAISVQKAVRDQLEGVPVTGLYYGIAWFTTLLSIVLLTVGLWNADLVNFFCQLLFGFCGIGQSISILSCLRRNTESCKNGVQGLDRGTRVFPF